ncbi:ZYRO0F04158p [Zygosaccharomyces rouxii]|uniref:ZYRO0F04158p n=1 Tax=Zygosaccharomyces rouxii (strain ATCC 2623 / CBS 732 / NBRC 1130 / NCYC 568 / NRRL Y-229) TaxID=559307 RepID=C5DXD5_ZYGRC|nr:uncharacterized protein ZYRO0F04158g [Zygosaccharomyces rouxii]KAH9199209.1 hypothetical protein LQ764DRAFT_179709 [Zygosaccharomyces rouxii]CAR28446.1 ZYRO0F04158p [Zygosaccharomyces rouxii]
MKLLRDLVINRREFQDWHHNLHWGRDGSLYMTTYPEICIGQPIFRKDVENTSKNLFHVKDHALEYSNKFEFDHATMNSLLNSQPVSHAKLCKPSPVDSLLAILTNNLNVLIFKDQRLLASLDEGDKSVERRSYHSLQWSPDGNYIVVGNEASELVVFKLERTNDEELSYCVTQCVQLNEGENWVTHICWEQDAIVAALDDNSAYAVDVAKGYEVTQVKSPCRFKIVDVKIVGVCVLITAAGHFYCLEPVTQKSCSLKLGPGDEFYIIPLLQEPNCVILISDRTSCKVKFDDELTIVPDHRVSPHLERKFKKWSTISNEFGKYEATMLIHGVELSPDGYSVAIAYSMERISTRYRIVSERQFNITFIPLFESWQISKKAIGLAWYQTYQIYRCTLPVVTNDTSDSILNKQVYDLHMDFKTYLSVFMNDNQLNKLRFFNFIEDKPSIDLFRRAIFEFAITRKLDLENPLDKACVQSLANVLGTESPVEVGALEMQSDFITESFDFNQNNDPTVIVSEQNHAWRRCAVTLLPILTTKVKVCPISNQRVIDIKRDTFNNYGWFTKTLLEALNNESVYTGTTMQTC